MRNSVIIIIFLSAPFLAFSQEINQSERITAIAEELASDEENPGDADLFADLLYELSENPVRINSGDENEISRLFFLTDFQVKVLADYIKTSGRIVSPFEIANIPGFDREITEMLIPFITFDLKFTLFQDSVRSRQILLANFTFKTSMQDSSFIGSPWKSLIKYKLTAAGFSCGFTAEKDPGEKLFSGRPPMPDFLSGYLSYEGHNILRHIILGDFSVRFGQGTCINTGMRTGLSLSTPGFLSGRNEIKPYTSVDENNFFRGAAVELSYKNIDFSFFVSRKKIDASLNDSADSADLTIKSFYKTGLHNNSESILKKDAATETGYGVNLSYNFNNLRTGVVLKETTFSLPVLPLITDPANRFDFSGRKNTLLSVYYNALFKRFIFFGEFSASGLNNNAFVQGVSIRPADRMNINFVYRSSSHNFVSFHASGPSGGSVNSNEYGMFGNFTIEAARYFFISAGSDIRYYPWLRFRCSSPSLAKKYELKLRYLPSQKLTFEALYNYRSTIVDNGDENRIPGQNEIMTSSVRGSVKYSPADYLTIIIRADYKMVNPSGSKGMLLLHDINLRFRNFPVSVWMRYCIFNTGGFESGIYAWENDLLNSFSIPGLYGNGNRAYIMASCKIANRVQFRLKYCINSTEVINNRMNEVQELKLQLRITI